MMKLALSAAWFLVVLPSFSSILAEDHLSPELTGPLFGPLISVPVGPQAYGGYVLAGNFNADSNPDLMVAATNLGKVSLLLGNGDGTFTFSALYQVSGGGYAYSMISADFNRDGDADVAVTDEVGGINILLGTGTGLFFPQPVFGPDTAALYIATDDFNGDGKLDLGAAGQGTDLVSVFLGVGNGSFTFSANYPVDELPRGIVAGDLDEDGKADLITANRTGQSFSRLKGNGDGTFQAAVNSLLDNVGRPSPLLGRDFDSDGHIDLAVGGDSTFAVWISPGQGNGTFPSNIGAPTTSFGTPIELATGDFNRDGHPDIAEAEYFTQKAGVLLGAGDGRFAPVILLDPGFYPYGVAIADFDQDGWDDLAVASSEATTVSIFLNLHPFPGSCNDSDGDGFGFPGDPSCPGGALVDCNDGSGAIYPGAADPCDGVDNNCNGADGVNDDLDGFTTCSGDCDDTRKGVHPGAREYCDGSDQDCDGSVDVPAEEAKSINFVSPSTFDWAASGGYQVQYNVYRGNLAAGTPFAYNQACFLPSLPSPSASDSQAPLSAKGFYYVVAGRNTCGEGTLGPDSFSAPRPNSLPCP